MMKSHTEPILVLPKLRPFIPGSLTGRVALVTGASRGIGAQIALLFAEGGADLVLNYRSKGGRAEEIAAEITKSGRIALPLQADLTIREEVGAMMAAAKTRFGGLDFLVLNASGGLEKGKPEGYSMLLNLTAQVQTLDFALPLLRAGATVVFVTSHLAHFYGEKPVYPGYEPVAMGKKAGEEALLERIPELSALGVSLIIVSGDMIDGTITPRLLNRQNPGLINTRKEQAGRLPTIDEFAKAIVDAATDDSLPTGQVILVGNG
jgi:3-oxoacyl-[acyl-carrier protein] reductase